jgi:PAS domain S-box-containing protein
MKDIEKKLEQINFELRERVKELTVAYEICHSLSSPSPLDSILNDVLKSIAKGMQYEDAVVILHKKDKIISYYGIKNEKEALDILKKKKKISSEIDIHKDEKWYMTVVYKDDKEEFLKEEQSLIDALSTRIRGTVIKRKIQEKLKQTNFELRERVKELTVAYEICHSLGSPSPIDVILSNVVKSIAKGMQYEDAVVVLSKENEVVAYYGIEDKEEALKLSKRKKKIFSKMKMHKDETWTLSVIYKDEKEEFLKEEQSLIDAISTRIRETVIKRRIQEKLKASEKKYRTLFENTGTAMCTIEEDTIISFANKEFETLSGYSKEDIEGKMSWTQLIHKEDLERMKKYHYERRRDRKKPPRCYEFKFVDKTGNVKNTYLTIDMIPGTKKSIASIIDITERKKAEEALKKSEEQYRTLFEEAGDVIISLDTNYKITTWNPMAEKVYGYKKEEVIGKNIEIIIPEWKKEDYLKRMKSVVGGKIVKNITTQRKNKRGDILDIMMTLTSLRDGEDNIVGIMEIQKDLTKIENIEQRMLLFSEVIKSTSDGIVITDLTGTTLYINKACQEMCGYNVKEVIGRPSSILFESKKEFQKEVFPIILEKGWKGKITIAKKNGEIMPLLMTSDPMKNKKGQTLATVFIFKKKEKKLWE